MPDSPDFTLFQSECRRWIDYFGLKDFTVHYQHIPIKDAFARISYNVQDRTCVLKLNSDEDETNMEGRDIPKHAFHEVVHLLMAKLLNCAECRFVTDTELAAEEESVVRILENTVYRDLSTPIS
jgi:hypothetical protein